MSFLEWNAALGAHFFPETGGKRTVRLYVDAHILDRIGQEAGLGGYDAFLKMLKKGPELGLLSAEEQQLSTRSEVFAGSRIVMRRLQYDFGTVDGRTSWRISPPPFLPYLAGLVLAWTRSDRQKGYHDALRIFLKKEVRIRETQLQAIFGSNAICDLSILSQGWDRLEAWAEAQGAGNKLLNLRTKSFKYVGKIFFHAVAGQTEAGHLWTCFHEAKLEPGRPPDRGHLIELVERYGRDHPRDLPNIRKLLQAPPGHELKLVHELILTKFEEWEGGPYVPDTIKVSRKGPARLRLKLCLDANFNPHFRLSGKVDPHALTKHLKAADIQYSLEEEGWSDPLRLYSQPREKVGVSEILDWEDYSLPLEELKVRFASRDHFVFVPASNAGRIGNYWISTSELPEQGSFVLLVSGEAITQVEKWGSRAENCASFQSRGKGLFPEGWQLFWGEHARTSIPDLFEVDTVDNHPEIRLANGNRESIHAFYWPTLPDVKVTRNPETIALAVNRLEATGPSLFPEPYVEDRRRFRLLWGEELQEFPAPMQFEVGGTADGHRLKPCTFKVKAPPTQSLPPIQVGTLCPPRIDTFKIELEGRCEGDHLEGYWVDAFLLGLAEKWKTMTRETFLKKGKRFAYLAGIDRHFDFLDQLEQTGKVSISEADTQVELKGPMIHLLPYNATGIRALITGALSIGIRKALTDYCQHPHHQVQLTWLPEDEFALANPSLKSNSVENLQQLHAYMDQRFPGMIHFEATTVSGPALLSAHPSVWDYLTQLEEIDLGVETYLPQQGTYFDVEKGTFETGVIPDRFPLVIRRHHGITNAHIHFIWLSPKRGYQCEWNKVSHFVWHQCTQEYAIHQFHPQEAEIMIPDHLPIPNSVARALRLCSPLPPKEPGQPACADTSPKTTHMRCFAGIGYALKKELFRILYGLEPEKFSNDIIPKL